MRNPSAILFIETYKRYMCIVVSKSEEQSVTGSFEFLKDTSSELFGTLENARSTMATRYIHILSIFEHSYRMLARIENKRF